MRHGVGRQKLVVAHSRVEDGAEQPVRLGRHRLRHPVLGEQVRPPAAHEGGRQRAELDLTEGRRDVPAQQPAVQRDGPGPQGGPLRDPLLGVLADGDPGSLGVGPVARHHRGLHRAEPPVGIALPREPVRGEVPAAVRSDVAVRASGQAGQGDDRREAEQHVAPWYGGEHPETGWLGAEVVTTNYVIIVEGAEDGAGYSSYAPDLPGVIAAGETDEECVALMREAVVFHLDGMREDGDPMPEPRVVGTETVPAA